MMYLFIANMLYLFNKEKGIDYAQRVIATHHCRIEGGCDMIANLEKFVNEHPVRSHGQ